MGCPDESELDLFVAGKSDEARRSSIEAHLATCAECRAVVSSLAQAVPGDAATVFEGATKAGGTRTFAVGSRVAGRYRIVRFIAEGGMGEVYEAEDQMLGARIALKTIRAEIAAQLRMLDRFRREIVFARKVTHPNVCRIFDMGTHEEAGQQLAFLTMELIPGQTLTAWLAGRRLSEAEALPIVEQMAQGLAAAHAERVVHRDFKSHNVMLVERDDRGLRVVITDFGLARGEESEESGVSSSFGHGLVGSPPYMAPEQVNGLRVDAAADLYALGVVLYEMTTGKLPFVGATPMLTAIKRLTEDPPSPRVVAPGLGIGWSDAILRCLRRDPKERFGSALELVAALRAAPVELAPPRSWVGPAVMTVGVGVAIVIAAALGMHWHKPHGARPNAPVAAPQPTPTPVPHPTPALLPTPTPVPQPTPTPTQATSPTPKPKHPSQHWKLITDYPH